MFYIKTFLRKHKYKVKKKQKKVLTITNQDPF